MFLSPLSEVCLRSLGKNLKTFEFCFPFESWMESWYLGVSCMFILFAHRTTRLIQSQQNLLIAPWVMRFFHFATLLGFSDDFTPLALILNQVVGYVIRSFFHFAPLAWILNQVVGYIFHPWSKMVFSLSNKFRLRSMGDNIKS